jgi:5-methylcytosine-specific restriction protein B
VLNDHRKNRDNCFVLQVDDDLEELFGDQTSVASQKIRWLINSQAFDRPEAYLGIIDHAAQGQQLSAALEARKGNLLIKQLPTGSIQVWEDGAQLPEAKPMLRKLASELGLNTLYASGRPLNTRSLGVAVISALNASAT